MQIEEKVSIYNSMKITDFSKQITLSEGMKTQVSIAQVKEILKCINDATEGQLYSIIKKIPITK